MGQGTGHKVGLVIGGDRNQNIGILSTRIFEDR
jgi:hypothetical protein